MGFGKSSVNVVRFKVLDAVPSGLDIVAALRRFALQEIDEVPETLSVGWTSSEDMLDTGFVQSPLVGEYAFFDLRVDERKIPGSVLKKHVKKAVEEELAQRGKTFMSRAEKNEIRGRIGLKLRMRYLPVPSVQSVVWNIQGGEIWYTGNSAKQVEAFMELFVRTFDLHLEQLAPVEWAVNLMPDREKDILQIENTVFGDSGGFDEIGMPAGVNEILGRDFLTWLWYVSGTGDMGMKSAFWGNLPKDEDSRPDFYLGKKIVMTDFSKQSLTLASPESDFSEIRGTITQSTKKVESVCLFVDAGELHYSMNLGAANLFMSGLKCPKVEKNEDDDMDALLLEKVYLLEKIRNIYEALFKTFLALRLDAGKWADVCKDIQEWSLSK